jgi:hypothetical protein
MRTRIKNWIRKYIATANPYFDPSRVLLRPFRNKVHFCGLIRAILEDGAGACLDSVEPIALHTSADDIFGNGGAVLTYLCDNSFQQRIVYELLFEYGTNEHCAAKSRSEFPDLCVRYALDKPLQRAMRNLKLRSESTSCELMRTESNMTSWPSSCCGCLTWASTCFWLQAATTRSCRIFA